MTPYDVAADCVSLDGSETITLTLRRPEGVSVVTVAGALKRSLARREESHAGIALVGDEIVWHVPHSALPAGEQIQPGDTVTAGNDVWTIVAAQHATFGTRWRCACRRQPDAA
ncbi:MAG: hypothetical protein ACT4QC_22145 [Planctomycetaceae bacterium]